MAKIILRRQFSTENVSLSSLPLVLQKIYAGRGITSMQELNKDLTSLLPYSQLMNITEASAVLGEAVIKQKRILIIGDFDTDGATSTALAVNCLKAMGASEVDFLVPNRFDYGYGLTPEIVEVAAKKSPDLIVTVDNGIASHAGVERARSLGIEVLITDHHLPGKTIPEHCVIVNPNQKGDTFPSKFLAGVGVIFYVMLGLRSWLHQQQWFEKQAIECPNMSQYLDLVALGTVADLVPLDHNNRVLVHQGLRRVQAGYARPGILALLKIAGREAYRITTADFGYAVAPRLNAAGRLDDMTLGISCLLAEDFSQASAHAKKLDQLNQERRVLESQMQKEALEIVNGLDLRKQLKMGLCLYDPDWHQGIVGLVASRMKEKFHRPVIAFAKVAADTLKGSARSVKGLHIRDLLDNIATEFPELLSKFGGHAMAAGLSIPLNKFNLFSEIFSEKISQQLSEEDIKGKIETDGELAADEFTLESAKLLRQEGPWGQGFPEPAFDGYFNILNQQIIGKNHLKLRLQIPDTKVQLEALAFQIDLDHWPDHRCAKIQAVYRLDVNEFNQRQQLQLIIEEIKKCA